jgi:hypothetical protein
MSMIIEVFDVESTLFRTEALLAASVTNWLQLGGGIKNKTQHWVMFALG